MVYYYTAKLQCSCDQIFTFAELRVKIYKQGTFIEACDDIFFNEIIEYDITNENPM